MGKDLYEASPRARALFDMGERAMPGLLSLLFDGEEALLTRTENAQPALFLTSLAFAEELRAAGIEADACAGFSLGEIPALAYTGVLSVEDAFRLVLARGKKMGELAARRPGAMAAVLKLDAETVEAACKTIPGVTPVNYNCPGQIACAGTPEAVDALCESVRALGGRGVRLMVSGAFHTAAMAETEGVLSSLLREMGPKAPSLPLYADLTGDLYPTEAEEIIRTISRQVVSPVRFQSVLEHMHAAGVNSFIEVGAGSSLTGFVRRTLPDARLFTVTDVPTLTETIRVMKGACDHA